MKIWKKYFRRNDLVPWKDLGSNLTWRKSQSSSLINVNASKAILPSLITYKNIIFKIIKEQIKKFHFINYKFKTFNLKLNKEKNAPVLKSFLTCDFCFAKKNIQIKNIFLGFHSWTAGIFKHQFKDGIYKKNFSRLFLWFQTNPMHMKTLQAIRKSLNFPWKLRV